MENSGIEKLKEKVEAIVLADIRLEWNGNSEILRSFIDMDIVDGINQTVNYWEEFKKSDIYKGYWENPKLDINAPSWLHANEIMLSFAPFIRNRRNNE